MMKTCLLTLGLLLLGRFGIAGETDLKLFDSVWNRVDSGFYDPDHHGVDWEFIGEIYRARVKRAESEEEVRELLNKMLAELHASHTTIIDADVYEATMAELFNRPFPTLGVLIEESLPGRFFVRALYEGGPMEMAGLKVGDRIVAVDGKPIASSDLLVNAGYDPGLPGAELFFLRADRSAIDVTVQTNPDANSRRDVRVAPATMSAVDATRNSIEVVEHDGMKIGKLHIWFCSRGVSDALRDAVTGPLADCDALILDIRGRGGFTDVVSELLDVFRGERTMRQRFRGEASKPLWVKPLVVLIDDRSRSAKEVFSQRLVDLKLGTLVGQRTEGAVLGATFHKLPDGSYLELGGMEVPVSGKSLEGVGVAPHVDVDYVIPYSHGVDPILSKGIEVAIQLVEQREKASHKLIPL